MSRGLAAALLVLMLLSTPHDARAGTEDAPEVTDPTGDASPAYDLQAAWFGTEGDGLRFTVRVQQAAQPQRDVLYYVAFTLDGERVMAGIGYDGQGRLLTYVGPLNVGVGGQGLETFANGKVQQARHQPGRPTDLTGVVPFDAVEGLGADATLTELSAGVDRLDRGRRWVAVDLQNTDRSYTVESVGLAGLFARAPGTGSGAGAVALGGLAVAAAVVGGAYLYARRDRSKPDEARPEARRGPSADGGETAEGRAEDEEPAKPATSEGPHRLRLDPRDRP